MTVQQLAIQEIESGLDDLFKSARTMPEDKLHFKPTENNRSALELLQECAQSLKWPQYLLADKPFSGDPAEGYAKALQERAQWTTVDACEKAARENWQETKAFIASYPDSDLDRMVDLPFKPDMRLSVGQILTSPHWNMAYHLGQLSYIQLMYGDKEMH